MTHSPREDHGTVPVRAGPPVIGVSGGIASGKSEVARSLAGLGAVLLDADAIGHEVLHDPQVKQALRDRWGQPVFDSDGTIIRRAVAERVFGPTADHKENRKFLEQVTHPLISRQLALRILDFQQQDDIPAVVLDAALLFEAGWDQLCDVLLFVDAAADLRRQRAAERGWDPTQLRAREAAQDDLETKRHRSHVILDNSQDREHLHAQVRDWWSRTIAARTASGGSKNQGV